MLPYASKVALSIARGGAVGEFDLDRAGMRLDGLAYPIVTTLMMGIAQDINDVTPKVIKQVPEGANHSIARKIRVENAATIAFSILNQLSIALGGYSTIIFSLTIIYSKTALGMHLDDEFHTFFADTSKFRESGFYAFLFSVLGVSVSQSLSGFLKHEGIMRWIESVPSAVIVCVGLLHYRFMMKLASKLIFSQMN